MSDQIQPQAIVKKNKSKKIIKLGLILFSMLISCFVLLGIFFALKLDLQFVSLSVQGVVSDSENNPIADAEIFLNNTLITSSDENGAYRINGLNEGRINLRVEKEGFSMIEEIVDINRSGLNYSIRKDFILENTQFASLRGSFIANSENYDFSEDRIVINDDESFRINNDGTFEITQIPAGEVFFNFKSTSFKDIVEELQLSPGSNTLQDVELIEAGDIIHNVESYIRENEVNNIRIEGEAISPDMIEISNNNFLISDLDIGREYNIRITAPGYETRDYTITISQGENKLENLRFVEAGSAIYLTKTGEDRDFLFYRSDFDGADLEKIIDEDFEQISYYFDPSDNKLFIESDRDRFRNALGGRANAIYELDLNSNILTRLTNESEFLGEIIPQYKARKLINLTTPERRSETIILEIMDFAGENREEVERVEGEIYEKILLSKDESRLAIQQVGGEIYGIDLSNNVKTLVAEGEDIELIDISENGRRIIYTNRSRNQSFNDLYVYDFVSREERSILADERGQDYQFLNNSDNTIIYFDEVRNQTDVYSVRVNEGTTNKLTNLTGLDEIEQLYQQGGYAFYITNRGLYIIDIQNPQSNKLILNGEFVKSNF